MFHERFLFGERLCTLWLWDGRCGRAQYSDLANSAKAKSKMKNRFLLHSASVVLVLHLWNTAIGQEFAPAPQSAATTAAAPSSTSSSAPEKKKVKMPHGSVRELTLPPGAKLPPGAEIVEDKGADAGKDDKNKKDEKPADARPSR